jgi:hypothetical protein
MLPAQISFHRGYRLFFPSPEARPSSLVVWFKLEATTRTVIQLDPRPE